MFSKSVFYKDFLLSGFGGQGILIAGTLLCYAALKEKREVTFFPSYGVEMRGGAANCYVVISDHTIGSPIPSHPEIAIIMSSPALERFQNTIKTGGTVFINDDIIAKEDFTREDVISYFVSANKVSSEAVGNDKLANMVMLGFMAEATKCVKIESLLHSIKEVVSEKHKKFIPLNEKAICAGAELFNNIKG
ncbi:MAG: 2-oxoacid:acceptor oxidoreductase family protein [bacterium]